MNSFALLKDEVMKREHITKEKVKYRLVLKIHEISQKVIKRHKTYGLDKILDYSLKSHVIICLSKLVEIWETFMAADGLEKFLTNTIMSRKQQSVCMLWDVLQNKLC